MTVNDVVNVQKFLRYPVHLVNFVRWKAGFCRRLRKYPPVFVYQMGKVASRSVSQSLARYYKGEVIHSHWFYPDIRPGESRELFRYWHSDQPPELLHIISLVRNPLERNISAFFQNFSRYTGHKEGEPLPSVDELKIVFLERFEHNIPLIWFDELIYKNFSIDVYAKTFPDKGFQYYSSGKVRLLIIRVEENDDQKNKAIQNFMNIPDFALERVNVSSEKNYGTLYKRFKQEVRFSSSYIDFLCNSKYFQHFYTANDEMTTRKKWQENYSNL
ncbi:putative capsular polysaccharide synthesis family protein [Desulfobulbus alkaliphilus]|uniref:putative capsular polysaccharide synthesis family protein n=1 Tax=Desulfobulbus alkaliphilus TaxID=869814 RepID=UPI00196698DC|nr:putative capsular polysaccharide synthesis family protein [Desulfobulbus alkaliphilus]MBM9538187.1 hypothetical protein [Desulfobulbus alkaliphilus]